MQTSECDLCRSNCRWLFIRSFASVQKSRSSWSAFTRHTLLSSVLAGFTQQHTNHQRTAFYRLQVAESPIHMSTEEVVAELGAVLDGLLRPEAEPRQK